MKEFVKKLREKADVFEKSGCAVDGIVKDYRKSADMIEGLCGKSNISGFVEKLIERLEEKKFIHTQFDGLMPEDIDVVTIGCIHRIVNELAEEYNQDLDKLSQEPKTRIDYIHSMSVEEMADKILASEISTAIDFCQDYSAECEKISESECRKCLIQYLNSPVEQKKVIPTKHFEKRFNTVM